MITVVNNTSLRWHMFKMGECSFNVSYRQVDTHASIRNLVTELYDIMTVYYPRIKKCPATPDTIRLFFRLQTLLLSFGVRGRFRILSIMERSVLA